MLSKRIFDITVGLFVFLFLSPLIILCSVVIFITSGGPIFFGQKRWGKGKKPFTMYKFRTMGKNAEERQRKLMYLNEADGPVFKIYNDPRYTKFGKILAHTGIDEIPQLINVLKGEMSLVGPRPLPISEAKRIPKSFEQRFSVLPGITSSWIVRGSHGVSFKKWMQLDLEYISNWSLGRDIRILYSTWLLMFKWICKSIFFWL